MKSKTVSFRTKLWLYFVLFAAVIFSLLWIMQTVGLQRFYDGMMKNNIRNAAKTIIAAGQSEDFFEIIDHLTFEESLLVYITDEEGRVFYSSDSYNPYFRRMEKPGRAPDREKPDRKIAPLTAVCRTITAIFSQGSLPGDPARSNIPMAIPSFTAPASPSTKMFSILMMMTGMKSSMQSFIQPERWEPSVRLPPSSGHSCFGSPVFHWCWHF